MSEENEEQMIPTPSDFGHFLLERELGHGGMGGVYLARDKMLDRKVAIKVMLKSLGDDPAFVERFQREAQAAARLNHPHIAQIYSFAIEQGMPYIAMELVSGGSLDKDMEANPGTLDPVRVMRIGQQMADALALAAEQGLVHGDVKPENVLYDAEGKAKLVDFGLAAMQGDSDEIWGTPYYISPEKVRRQKIDYRADIYSLGGTLYHALTGVAPFEGEDATEVVKARFNGPPKKPSEVRPDLPPELDAIILRMLEIEPSMRYPTYQSLLGDIKRFLAKAKPMSSTKSMGPKVKIKGTKLNMKLTAAETGRVAGDGDGVAELRPVGRVRAKPEQHRSVGALVGLVATGVVCLVVLVAGGLMWYVHAKRTNARKAEYRQLIEKRDQARTAVNGTMKSIEDFGVKFHELVAKGDKEVADAVRQVKTVIPAEMKTAAAAFIDVPPTKEIADAIAFTNKLLTAVVEAAAAEVKAAEKKAEPAKPAAEKKTEPAKPAAASAEKKAEPAKPAAAEVDADEAAAAKAEAEQEARVLGQKPAAAPAAKPEAAAAAAAPAPAAAAKPAEEKPAEAKPAEEDLPKLEVPVAVRQFVELWADLYACRAADIRVQGEVQQLLQKGRVVETLTKDDEATVVALAALSKTLADGYEQLKARKYVEQTQRRASVIRTKSTTLVRTAQQQIQRMVDEVERVAKARANQKAREEAAAKAAADHKAKVEEETKRAQTKFDNLVETRLRTLDWEPSIKQLQALEEEMTTAEGRAEAHFQLQKVQFMEELQKVFIQNAKGIKFKNGYVVSAVDEKAITIEKMKSVRGKNVSDGEMRIEWFRFYGKKENVGYMNQLINTLVIRGRETLKTGPLPWSRQMLGAALTLQLLYKEVEGADQVAPVLVKKAVKGFEESAKWAKKWFPDLDLEEE